MQHFPSRYTHAIAVALCLLVAAAAVLAFSGGTKAQQNNRCWLLEQELAAYDRSAGGNGQQAGRYDAAIQEQSAALRTAESRAERLGCFKRGFLFFQPDRAPQCPQLIDSIDRMERSLAQLSAERDRVAGPSRGDDPGRRRIVRLLQDNGCRGGGNDREARPQRNRSLFGNLFGEEDRPPQDGNFTERFDYGGNRMLGDQATYRTLCVRKCDGYYFPISFSTLPQQFDQDAEQCRAMCPSAIVDLYVHRNPGGSVEEMVALNGQPYSEIPTAFKYRKEYVEGCSCNPYTLALEEAEAEADGGAPATGDAPASEGAAQQSGQDTSRLNGEELPSSGQIAPGDEEDPGKVTIFRAGGKETFPAARFNAGVPGDEPNVIRIPPRGQERDEPGFSTGQSGAGDPSYQDPARQR